MNNATARVLIVDDMPVNRMILSLLLASRGVVSDQADGGLMCLDMVRAKDYELILLDHRMPEMDGHELIGKLRNDPATNTIPIIFLTGKNDRDHVFSILHYKPDGYLLKTLTKEALIDSIDRFFSESLFQMSLNHVIEDTD